MSSNTSVTSNQSRQQRRAAARAARNTAPAASAADRDALTRSLATCNMPRLTDIQISKDEVDGETGHVFRRAAEAVLAARERLDARSRQRLRAFDLPNDVRADDEPGDAAVAHMNAFVRKPTPQHIPEDTPEAAASRMCAGPPTPTTSAWSPRSPSSPG